MWDATFSNGGVDEKDVIIMTQMRQINDLEKSLKVAEKRLQLVMGFNIFIYCLFSLCRILFRYILSNYFLFSNSLSIIP